MEKKKIKHYKLKQNPTRWTPDAIYWIKPDGESEVRGYITDSLGQPKPLKDELSIVNTDGKLTITLSGTEYTINLADLDLEDFTNTSGDPFVRVSDLSGVTVIHNDLEDIQGGTEEERYHLTETEHTYLTDIVSNDTIGLILETLDTILYVEPDITNFSITPNIVEIGTTVTDITLNWNLNKTFTFLSINNGVGSITPSLLTLALSGLSLSSNTTYTITGGDGTNTDSASTSLNFRSRRWWGTSALDTFTGTDILDLQNSELATNRQQTRTINGGGDYIWFAFPTSFGLPSFVVNGLPNTAFTIQTASHTNASGNTQNYYVIRTNTVQNGTLTIQIL
jgi:hypothetical protein